MVPMSIGVGGENCCPAQGLSRTAPIFLESPHAFAREDAPRAGHSLFVLSYQGLTAIGCNTESHLTSRDLGQHRERVVVSTPGVSEVMDRPQGLQAINRYVRGEPIENRGHI